MEERSTGIILRTRPFTETSLVAQWLTRDLGRIATVAKGARRPKSPFLGKLDLFYEADFSFARSRRSELHTLREVSVRESHARLREEMGWLQQASYCAILLEKSTETETPIPELFELLQEMLKYLGTCAPAAGTVFAFELKLLRELGYEPGFESVSAAVRTAAETSMRSEFTTAAKTLNELEPRLKQELNRFLGRAIGTALERIPPQRDSALENAR